MWAFTPANRSLGRRAFRTASFCTMRHMRAFPVAKTSCYSRTLGIPSLGHPESSPAGDSASEAVASSPSRGLLARPARTPQHNAPSPPPSPQQRQRPRFTDRPPPLSRTHEARADQPAPSPSSSSGGDMQAGAQLSSTQSPRKCGTTSQIWALGYRLYLACCRPVVMVIPLPIHASLHSTLRPCCHDCHSVCLCSPGFTCTS